MILADIFLIRPTACRHACEDPRAALWAALFVAATGILYGVLLALFQQAIGGEMAGVPIADFPGWVLFGGNIASGLLITTAVHAGIAIVAWLMAKAIGGPGLFVGLYRASAYLLPLAWIALPWLAVQVAGAGRPVPPLPLDVAYVPAAFAGLGLALIGLFQVFEVTQGKGALRSGAAVALFALFSVSILMVF